MRSLSGTIAAGGAINKSISMHLSGLISTSATLSNLIAGLDVFIGKVHLSGVWAKTTLVGKFPDSGSVALSGTWAKATLIGTFHDSVKSLRGAFSSTKKLDGEL